MQDLNRKNRRTVESILSHKTTSEYERRVLASLGVRLVAKRDDRVIVPDMPIDCFDVWSEHVERVQVMFTREPKARQIHPSRKPRRAWRAAC